MSRTRSRAAWVLLLGAAAVSAGSGRAEGMGFRGRLEVRALELVYAPGAKSLRMRVFPMGALAIVPELLTTDGETIDRLLRLAEMRQRGERLDVEIEEGEIRAIDLAIGGPPIPTVGK